MGRPSSFFFSEKERSKEKPAFTQVLDGKLVFSMLLLLGGLTIRAIHSFQMERKCGFLLLLFF